MKTDRQNLSDEEEDQALGVAMEEGRREGIADTKEKQEFESYLYGDTSKISN